MTTDNDENKSKNVDKPASKWPGRIRDLMLFLVLFAAVGMFQARNLLPTGEVLDLQDVELRDGGTLSIDDLKGKPTIMVLWAPWCGVCGAESNNVSRVKRWLGDRVQVYSIALDYQTIETVDRFVEKHNVDYPIILGDDRLAKELQVSAFPSLYVLNKEGRIKHRTSGYTTTFGMLWRALL